MMTVREIARFIIFWEAAKKRIEAEKILFAINTYDNGNQTHNLYYGAIGPKENGLGHYLATQMSAAHEIAIDPNDVSAILEMTGIVNTWQTLIPGGTAHYVPSPDEMMTP